MLFKSGTLIKRVYGKIGKSTNESCQIAFGLKNLPYRERLIRLGLPALKYRRIRGDMIELYKAIKEHYDSDTVAKITFTPYASTRGNNFKLFSHHSTYELTKHFFINRVINVWNTIPNSYVINSPGLVVFNPKAHQLVGQCETRRHSSRSNCRI